MTRLAALSTAAALALVLATTAAAAHRPAGFISWSTAHTSGAASWGSSAWNHRTGASVWSHPSSSSIWAADVTAADDITVHRSGTVAWSNDITHVRPHSSSWGSDVTRMRTRSALWGNSARPSSSSWS